MNPRPGGRRVRAGGFTLVETLTSLLVAGILIIGIVTGYMEVSQQAEWAQYSLAAHSLAMQQVERLKGAKWDPMGYPSVDNVTSPPDSVLILDIPLCQTNTVFATNHTTVTAISTTPPLLKMIRVDCIWGFMKRGLFTNTVVTYRAPDQ